MAEVYRALDTRLGRAVALKVLPAHSNNDPKYSQRWPARCRTVRISSRFTVCGWDRDPDSSATGGRGIA